MRYKITPAMIYTKKVGVVCPILPYLRKVGNYPTYRNMTNTVKFVLNTIYPQKDFGS